MCNYVAYNRLLSSLFLSTREAAWFVNFWSILSVCLYVRIYSVSQKNIPNIFSCNF